MRPSSLLLAAALLIACPAATNAADPQETASPAPTSEASAPAADASTPPTATTQGGADAPAVSPAEAREETSAPSAPQPSPDSSDSAQSEANTAAPASTQAPTPQAPLVVTAQIDPELALRLSLLEKAMVAQTEGQSAVYGETSRLLMFFGSACVGMGLVAMVAAVFLMNRTLASVSAITAQVTHAQTIHALPPATSAALVPAGGPSPTGFEKVQASGQRFQNRMTSLEERLEELEHLAGSGGAPTSQQVAVPEAPPSETAPEPARPKVPVSAILVRKSETLMNLGKLDEAMAALDEAATHEGDPTEVHLARGRVLEKLGRLGDALHSYDLAVTTDGANAAALLMKAGVLNRQERFDEALSCYERALALHRANN